MPEDDDGADFAGELAAAMLDVKAPGLGVAGKHLLKGARAEWARLRSVALTAAEHASGLSREDLAEEIERDPRLVPLVTRLLYAAGMNGHDPTLRALGAAFGEAVRDRERIDECDLILAALADLSDHHGRILRLVSQQPPEGARAWTPSLLERESELPARSTGLCAAALVARGLVASRAPFLGGGALYSVTDLGTVVLDVLDQYARPRS